MTETVLVTGANGFIGSHVVHELQRTSEFEVFLGVRRQPDSYKNSILFDLNDVSTIRDWGEPFDHIVHIASAIGWYEQDLFKPNVVGLCNLVDIACEMNSRFLFMSGAFVKGAEHSLDRSQADRAYQYARTKFLGEKILELSGIDNCILRPCGVFGLNGPDHLRLNVAISDAVKGMRPTLAGPGNGFRNYLYVKDLAKMVRQALSERISGTHIVAGCDYLRISEMLRIVAKHFFDDDSVIHIDGTDTEDTIFPTSPNFKSARSFEEALSDIVVDVSREDWIIS